MAAADDRRWLDLAARLGVRAAGDVEPNPLVGAVLVRDGAVIGTGHHLRFGGPHAEREALEDCRRRGHDPRGATCYVTLEPCRHTGKQPPCTEALIAAGVAKVVYAQPDPGAESGGGADVLRAAGIGAVQSAASADAVRLSDPFVHRVRTGRPWVIAKWAQTIDGRLATRTGESRWISGERARARVHRVRARVDVILTGLGTVAADDPMLTARGVRRVRRVARRVVLDPGLELPTTAALVRTAGRFPTAVACAKDFVTADIAAGPRAALEAAGVELLGVPEDRERPGRLRLDLLLAAMASRWSATNVLVEAGPGLIGALLAEDLVDEALVYVAPMVLGDEAAVEVARGRVATSLGMARRFELCRAKRVGPDVELLYRRPAP